MCTSVWDGFIGRIETKKENAIEDLQIVRRRAWKVPTNPRIRVAHCFASTHNGTYSLWYPGREYFWGNPTTHMHGLM